MRKYNAEKRKYYYQLKLEENKEYNKQYYHKHKQIINKRHKENYDSKKKQYDKRNYTLKKEYDNDNCDDIQGYIDIGMDGWLEYILEKNNNKI